MANRIVRQCTRRDLRDGDICNGEPAVLVHHGIVRTWRCGSLVTQRPLPWLLCL